MSERMDLHETKKLEPPATALETPLNHPSAHRTTPLSASRQSFLRTRAFLMTIHRFKELCAMISYRKSQV